MRTILLLALLILLVSALFAPVIGVPFMAWDDTTYILNNPLVTHYTEQRLIDRLLTPQIGYIVPVTVFVEAVLFKLGGGRVWVFHAASLCLHSITVLFLFLICRRFCGRDFTSVLLAGLFALHPIVVEPVAWAIGIKDLLMALFALAATDRFLATIQAEKTSCRWLSWSATILLALAAIFAKPTGALVPLAWLGYLVAQRKRGRPILGLGSAAILSVAGLAILALNKLSHDLHLVEHRASIESGPVEPLLALGYHAKHLFWPVNLHPFYFVDRQAGFSDPHTLLGLLVVITIVGSIVAFRRCGGTILGVGILIAAYLPVSSLLPFARMIADSYLYLPLAGLCIAFSPHLGPLRKGTGRRVVHVSLLVLIVGFVPLTMRQVRRWESATALWRPVAATYPRSPQPWSMLAQGLDFARQPHEAADAYGQAFARAYLPKRLNALAQALFDSDQWQEAECVMAEDVHWGPKPQRALHNLALLLVSQPKHPIQHVAEALSALRWAREARAKGQLSWPLAWHDRIIDRLEEAEKIPAPRRTWPKRSCAVLQRNVKALAPKDG